MTEVWKFPISVGRNLLRMPADAKMLDVQMQEGLIVLWARVRPSNPQEPREVVVAGTGHVLPDDATAYIGTVQDFGLVWHAFEVDR